MLAFGKQMLSPVYALDHAVSTSTELAPSTAPPSKTYATMPYRIVWPHLVLCYEVRGPCRVSGVCSSPRQESHFSAKQNNTTPVLNVLNS